MINDSLFLTNCMSTLQIPQIVSLIEANGIKVIQKGNFAGDSVYLRCQLFERNHPHIIVRISNHAPNSFRVRKQGLDVNVRIDTGKKIHIPSLVKDITVCLMRRWANPKGKRVRVRVG